MFLTFAMWGSLDRPLGKVTGLDRGVAVRESKAQLGGQWRVGGRQRPALGLSPAFSWQGLHSPISLPVTLPVLGCPRARLC